jgi:hypothetical protein
VCLLVSDREISLCRIRGGAKHERSSLSSMILKGTRDSRKCAMSCVQRSASLLTALTVGDSRRSNAIDTGAPINGIDVDTDISC